MSYEYVISKDDLFSLALCTVRFKKDFMNANAMTENEELIHAVKNDREVLERFERSKILEVYFSRIDGRIPKNIPESYRDLYKVEISSIKNFLLGQHPQDTLLSKLFRIMH